MLTLAGLITTTSTFAHFGLVAWDQLQIVTLELLVILSLHSHLQAYHHCHALSGMLTDGGHDGPIAVKCIALLPKSAQAFKNELKIHRLASGNAGIVNFYDHHVIKASLLMSPSSLAWY